MRKALYQLSPIFSSQTPLAVRGFFPLVLSFVQRFPVLFREALQNKHTGSILIPHTLTFHGEGDIPGRGHLLLKLVSLHECPK